MADDYTDTSEHYIPVPAITDPWQYTREWVDIRTRLNKGLAGMAAYNSLADNYVLAAANAGAILSSVGTHPRGRVIGAASGQDPTLTFALNTGAALSEVWTAGVDDSDSDTYKIESASTLGSTPELRIDTSGNMTLGSGTGSLINVAGNLAHRSAPMQWFQFQLYNNGGTLQHHIISMSISGGGAATYSGQITGASATLQNTPSVAAGVDFVTGGGINAANPEQFVFNTAVQPAIGLMRIAAVITANNSGTTIFAEPQTSNINVNGTTRVRFTVKFWKTNRTVFTIDTTNIPTSAIVTTAVFGFIA